METTEKIVEAYVRYIKGWATIPNIKCKGQFEIDLLAIDPRTFKRFHIETGVATAAGFQSLTGKEFSSEELKKRTKSASQRRTLGYFRDRKFSNKEVVAKLAEYGFKPGKYKKIIVTWRWNEDAELQAKEADITLWCFSDLVTEIAKETVKQTTYFTDDTIRTLQLMAKSKR